MKISEMTQHGIINQALGEFWGYLKCKGIKEEPKASLKCEFDKN